MCRRDVVGHGPVEELLLATVGLPLHGHFRICGHNGSVGRECEFYVGRVVVEVFNEYLVEVLADKDDRIAVDLSLSLFCQGVVGHGGFGRI